MDSRHSQLPSIYQKSLAVCDISQAVSSYFTMETKFLKLNRFAPLRHEIALSLVNDAVLIPKSVNEALNSNSREQQLKQLSLISIMVKNMLSYCNGLEKDGVKEKEYVYLLRAELKSFKKVFKSWRKTILSI